jgi:catechol 2,3-dioxygenase-like lactoylglutathione lyase family enzyme
MARGLDHLVLGVRDLDAAAAFYEKLGFTVGARNKHPWGTHNRIVQTPGVFLELITVAEPELIPEHAPGAFSFGAFVRDELARGEGMSMLALESADARLDNDKFAQTDISDGQPFHFSRSGVKPDGSPVTVAFTLAFARDDAAPHCGFFVCQQHNPGGFWNKQMQQHANSVTRISAVTMVARKPHEHARFLRVLTGGGLSAKSEDGASFILPRGRIDVMTPAAYRKEYDIEAAATYFAGFIAATSDINAVKRLLERNKIRHIVFDERVIVPRRVGFGADIIFEKG